VASGALPSVGHAVVCWLAERHATTTLYRQKGADDMSEANLQQFLSKIAKDSTLQDQLKNLTDKATFTQTLVRLGHAGGVEFTAGDVDAFLAKNAKNPLQELNEAELASVAGGLPSSRPPATSDGCGAAWTTLFGWC
jgi:predicted ribosomally synthesized peptide with nif11-like leader